MLTVLSAQAQDVRVPLNFGTTNSMVNEFGLVLPGTANDPGALVQILEAKLGYFPPDVDGNPHSNNPVIMTSRIGEGTDPARGPIGKVSGSIGSLANRSSENNTNTIFARIFNAASLAESSFYTDSQLYDVPVYGDNYGIFFIDAQKTDTPLDAEDSDGDGLHNSWEKSYTTDPGNPDSDEDGISDGNEVLAGTDPLDDQDLLLMVELIPAGNGNLMVSWDAVAGKNYQLEYSTSSQLQDEEFDFTSINPPVLATNDVAWTVVTNGTLPDAGTSFRARVIHP